MSALPQYAPFEISKAVSAHSIALGFIKNTDGEFEFVGPFAAEIEKYFDLNLVDDLTSETTHAENTVEFFPRTLRPTAAPADRAADPLWSPTPTK